MVLEKIAKAVADLLHPYAEVVIHDMAEDKILAIHNSFTGRKVGDDSMLIGEHEMELTASDGVIGPYEKPGGDRRLLKSISVPLDNPDGGTVALMCINLDVTDFEKVRWAMGSFLKPVLKEKPMNLFQKDLQEPIDIFVDDYLRRQGKAVEHIGVQERKELVRQLKAEGGLDGKKSVDYVSRILKVCKTTIYRDLKD